MSDNGKRALAIRHVGFEDLGSLARPLTARGFAVDYLEAGLDDVSPLLAKDAPSPDLLIVLGGPIGAYEDERYPFLSDEIALIERRIAENRPVLGICLGAQLIARALGARVFPGKAKEIGWSPLEPGAEAEASCLAPLAETQWQVLHWHGDTFDLPQGARRLASTPLTENQAFSHGPHILALQFHIEVEAGAIERWLIGHAVEITAAGIDPAAIRDQTRRWGKGLERAAPKVLDAWLAAT